MTEPLGQPYTCPGCKQIPCAGSTPDCPRNWPRPPRCGVCGEPAQYIAHYDRRLDPDGPRPPKWTGLEVPLCESCMAPADESPPGWAYEVIE